MLFSACRDQSLHKGFRLRAVAQMRVHHALYQQHLLDTKVEWKGRLEGQARRLYDYGRPYEAFLLYMSQCGNWGDSNTLQALCDTLVCRAHVISPQGVLLPPVEPRQPHVEIQDITLVHTGNHYESVSRYVPPSAGQHNFLPVHPACVCSCPGMLRVEGSGGGVRLCQHPTVHRASPATPYPTT